MLVFIIDRLTSAKDFLPPQKFVEPPANVSLDSSPVKILFFFVVSGRSARQVVRLLNLIYSQHHFYYIHVDVVSFNNDNGHTYFGQYIMSRIFKRCDYLYDQLIHLESKVDNIKLKRQRLTVVWAGPSQISVLIESLRDLFGGLYGQWRWDFVINLTESDFPLWTLSDFEWFLASHPGKNFLHPTSSEKNYPAVQGFDRSFLECEGRMWQFGRRKIPDGFTLYGVSEHYIITKEFAQYVSSTSPDSQLTDINLMFNHTILAPETYLATVLINSRFCGTAVWQNLRHVNWVSTTRKKCLRKNLVDWCISSPNDFRYGDEKKFLSTFNPRYFGRKFEAIVDQRVIEALEARLVERLYQQFGKINSNFTTADRPGLHSYWENHYSKKYDNKSVAHGTAELLVDLAGLSLNKLAKIRKSHDAQAEHITKTFVSHCQF